MGMLVDLADGRTDTYRLTDSTPLRTKFEKEVKKFWTVFAVYCNYFPEMDGCIWGGVLQSELTQDWKCVISLSSFVNISEEFCLPPM